MTHIERLKLCNRMIRYSTLIRGDEIGDYCKHLYQTAMLANCMSKEFENAIDREVQKLVTYFENNAEIINEEVNPKPYKIEVIKWKYE